MQKNLAQSTISKILKRSSELLEGELLHPGQKRRRIPTYPGLHDALYVWMRAIENHTTITRNILKAKAAQLFPHLYPGETPLKFSEGWLTGWKEQYGVKEYKSHGESGSAPITEAQQQMKEIQAVLSEYELCDIYNGDETAYYWQMQPDHGLATHQLAGKKKDKARITVMVTSNGDGLEREPLWIIESAKHPRCFKNVDIHSLRCQYRYNKAAWMRTDIMIDYHERFNHKMAHRNRKVVLLLDNFSAHQSAVAQLGGDQALSNVCIQWLPKNTTSAFQPDDQGII